VFKVFTLNNIIVLNFCKFVGVKLKMFAGFRIYKLNTEVVFELI